MHALTVYSPHPCSCADSNADSVLQLQGYTAAGQTAYALDSLQWIANYFVQNHHADLAFTGQIGNVGDDHSSWGRPENMTEDRPGFDLTPTAPGDFCPPYFTHFTSFPLSSLLLSFHCKQTQLAMHTHSAPSGQSALCIMAQQAQGMPPFTVAMVMVMDGP